jgi:3'-5' exoribonuclease
MITHQNKLKNLKISSSEIKNLPNGTQVESYFCVKYMKPPVQYTSGYRFVLGLGDRDGEMELSYWGGQNLESVWSVYNSLEEDAIVKVSGEVDSFQGRKRINVNEGRGQVRLANPDEYDFSDFIHTSNQDPEEMLNKILETIESFENPYLKRVMEAFFQDDEFVADFKKAPAAMYIHHACIGGLLEHTWEVLNYCEMAAKIHPSLDRDLLFAGAILHDVGKIEEFKVSMSIKQSMKGMLLGHTFIGIEMVSEKISQIPDFPPLLMNKVIHMILSHQGKNEYGGGQPPKLPEAAALHYADEIGSKVTQYIRAKKDASTDDFRSPWNRRIGSIFLK